MSRWFRHYAGMMRDDKLVAVAIRSHQSVERVLWVWGAILESAAEVNEDGRYELDAAEAAYFLRADEADINSIIAGLESAGRLSAGAVVKWGLRQFQSDRSAERQRRYRDKHKSDGDGRSEEKTPVSDRHSDARVTSPRRYRDAPDTETDTDIPRDKSLGPLEDDKAPEAELFERGKRVLGKTSGGIIAKLLAAKGGSIALARAAIEQASTKQSPREYVAAIIEKAATGPPASAPVERYAL
jgi:hypothetical protein